MRFFSITLFVLAVSGCVMSSVNRIGDHFEPYAKDCAIDYRYGDMGKAVSMAQVGYVQVGSMTVVRAGDSFTDSMKAEVGPKACALGGEVVMMVWSSAESSTGASLVVFRRVGGIGVSRPKVDSL